ncbi:MAG: hypothetical protein NTW19_10755 [Planctomycetota bacterium]|nr:hypothetical protein [Planctomycetota bacterium]
MNDKTTWRPPEASFQGRRVNERDLPDSAFAFPRRRKEPLVNEQQVRDVIERFAVIKDVMADDREAAFANLQAAAAFYGIELKDKNWYELFRRVKEGQAKAQGTPPTT